MKRRKSPQNVKWALDPDYLDKLSPEDRAWYEQFLDEYYNGSIKKGDPKAIHNTDSLRKDCYNRKNSMNRDLQGIQDCYGNMSREDVPQPTEEETDED